MRAYLLAVTLVATTASAQPALGERMLVAEDQRAPTDAELATLKQGLGSSDAATRRQAVRAIGRLERADLLPVISPLLTDRNTDVRIEAINALGQVARAGCRRRYARAPAVHRCSRRAAGGTCPRADAAAREQRATRGRRQPRRDRRHRRRTRSAHSTKRQDFAARGGHNCTTARCRHD